MVAGDAKQKEDASINRQPKNRRRQNGISGFKVWLGNTQHNLEKPVCNEKSEQVNRHLRAHTTRTLEVRIHQKGEAHQYHGDCQQSSFFFDMAINVLTNILLSSITLGSYPLLARSQ